MNRNEIFKAIEDERAYQDTKWSTIDAKNTPYNWAAYIGAYTNRSLVGVPGTDDQAKAFRKDMIKVAALAVAALEV
jgi:hypothetical protein